MLWKPSELITDNECWLCSVCMCLCVCVRERLYVDVLGGIHVCPFVYMILFETFSMMSGLIDAQQSRCYYNVTSKEHMSSNFCPFGKYVL